MYLSALQMVDEYTTIFWLSTTSAKRDRGSLSVSWRSPIMLRTYWSACVAAYTTNFAARVA